MSNTTTAEKPSTINGNRLVYGMFTLAGIIFLALQNFDNAIIYLGLALAFDPFNQAQPFHQRPKYQRIWLGVHAVLAMVALACLVFVR